jgi:hypothetical protein
MVSPLQQLKEDLLAETELHITVKIYSLQRHPEERKEFKKIK